MLTTRPSLDDITSVWTMSGDGEIAAGQQDNGDCNNDNGVIDLELFPALQGIVKMSDSKSGPKKTHRGGNISEDDELLNYFARTSEDEPEPEGENGAVKAAGESGSPPPPHTRHVSVTGRAKPSATVKVVTLCQGTADGAKILLVKEANRSKLDHVSTPRSCPNGAYNNSPSSPCSSVEDGQQNEANRCMSKNAIAARENRQRKKQHVDNLIKSVDTLANENSTLKTSLAEMKETIESLQLEVKYLRSVLANQSTLSKLLENIPMVPGLNLSKSKIIGCASNSFNNNNNNKSSRKRSAPADEADTLASDDECDCHPQKNVCMCSKENKYFKQAHDDDEQDGQADHSYATEGGNKPGEVGSAARLSSRLQKMRTRSQAQDTEGTTGGICLHVSGSSVSLEFCSTCSQQAFTGKQRNKKK